MVQIKSHEELEEWLKDKPADWAQVIAARAALRVLPSAVVHDGNENDKWMKASAIAFFRAVALPLISFDFSDRDMFDKISSAGAYLASTSAHSHATSAILQATMVFTSTETMLGGMFQNIVGFATSTLNFEIQSLEGDSARVWSIVSEDCNALENDDDADNAACRLRDHSLTEQLGFDRVGEWASASKRLYQLDPTYEVWLNFYDRRIGGHAAAFDIPGDQDRTEDKAILARLADATDEDFWNKGATYVNTALQRWINEARERVKPPLITDPLRQLDPIPEPIPPQNDNAISFTATECGKIRIDQTRNADALRTDGDAQDRHAEAIAEARALLARCRLSNSAARFVSGFENYLAAGGETLDDLRPSLFVQRGEKLRQEIAAYESGTQDSFLEPIADDLLIDFKGWRSAHNMTVGLDPLLNRLDTALLGPDIKPPLIPPSELHAFVADADEAEILDEGVREILDEAIDLAPAIPDANDRRTVWSVETVQNLVIEAFSVALNQPVRAAAVGTGVVVAAQLGVSMGLGDIVLVAGFLLANRKWVETKLNNTPTWKSLFTQLCDKAEKTLQSIRNAGDDGV